MEYQQPLISLYEIKATDVVPFTFPARLKPPALDSRITLLPDTLLPVAEVKLVAPALNGSVYVSDSATANVALANASINNGVTTFSLVNSANTVSGTYSVTATNSAYCVC